MGSAIRSLAAKEGTVFLVNDGISGGSSRQVIVIVEGDLVRSRLISARETARLMGLDDRYKLPPNYNEAYHLTGDGVAVPVVRHLAKHIFEPIIHDATPLSEVA